MRDASRTEGEAGSPRWDDWLPRRRLRQAMWAFLALGLALRLYRYLLRFPLSRDEAKLALSWIDRGFAELLQPLDYWQVAPALFLWGNLAVVRLAGFSELSLRLLPLVVGVAALLLMRRLCYRLLPEAAALLAFAIFAVSYYPVRFAT